VCAHAHAGHTHTISKLEQKEEIGIKCWRKQQNLFRMFMEMTVLTPLKWVVGLRTRVLKKGRI
jgi:hypothetical protein